MPAGMGGGLGGLLVGSIVMSSRGFLIVDRPRVRTSFVGSLMGIDFIDFPPPIIIAGGLGQGPGGGGGCW